MWDGLHHEDARRRGGIGAYGREKNTRERSGARAAVWGERVIFRELEKETAAADVEFGAVLAPVDILVTQDAPFVLLMDIGKSVVTWSDQERRQCSRDLAHEFRLLKIGLQAADKDIAGSESGCDD